MRFEKYITEAPSFDTIERKEWTDLVSFASKRGFKRYKNGKQNPMWDEQKGITYIDGWAIDKNTGFAIYTEDDSDSIYISWYAGGGPSGNDSLTRGYAKELAKEFKENDDRIK